MMDQHKFKTNVTSCINRAVEAGLSHHTIEKTLQQLAQNVRDERNIERIFEFECVNDCNAAFSHKVSKMEKRCDVCDDSLEIISHVDRDAQRQMRFTCPDHETTRVFSVSLDEITCPEHGKMELVSSHPA